MMIYKCLFMFWWTQNVDEGAIIAPIAPSNGCGARRNFVRAAWRASRVMGNCIQRRKSRRLIEVVTAWRHRLTTGWLTLKLN